MSLLLQLKPVGSKPHACYHFFSYPGEPPVYRNLRTPIVLSIATLRAVSDIPIMVYDISAGENDWGHFPDKLNFKVFKVEPRLEQYKELVDGWQYLSRINDLSFHIDKSGLNCDTIMYSDSDVFWLKNPLPFDKNPEKFVFNGWNTGFFYYDRYSTNNEKWHDIYNAYTKAAIYSRDVRNVMKKFVGYDGWYGVWDEMILTYMAHEHASLFNLTTVNEHSTTRTLQYANPDTLKMYHCNGTMVANPLTGAKHCRGLMALRVEEFRENLFRVLSHKDADMIFSREEQDYCLDNSFSLFKDLDRLMATKDEDGLFHVDKV